MASCLLDGRPIVHNACRNISSLDTNQALLVLTNQMHIGKRCKEKQISEMKQGSQEGCDRPAGRGRLQKTMFSGSVASMAVTPTSSRCRCFFTHLQTYAQSQKHHKTNVQASPTEAHGSPNKEALFRLEQSPSSSGKCESSGHYHINGKHHQAKAVSLVVP